MGGTDNIITRFAPSPTGRFHVGSVRTALFNYLVAKQNKGTFILRIEDTDTKRSREAYTAEIKESLQWLGLDWDVAYAQSQRKKIYHEQLQYLLNNDLAYVSNESPEREEGKRGEVIRFKNPNKTVSFEDMIVGNVSVDTSDLGDFVIAKDLDTPLYNFVVVVDDASMEISHVIRGQDHISNTPRQILIQEALGYQRPNYAHIPLILAPDKTKLSKRHGALPVLEYKKQGYLPEAILNFMALIGWNPGGEQEVYTLEELIDTFDLSRVQKGAGVFNIEKLNWFNRQYIQTLSDETFHQNLLKHLPDEITKLPQYTPERLTRIIPELRSRLEFFGQLDDLTQAGELQYFFTQPQYETTLLIWKKSDAADAKKQLEVVKSYIESMNNEFTPETVKETLWDYASQEGRGNVLWPLRVALSGAEKSPDPFILASVLGKEETLARIQTALMKLKEAA